jgi:hypothetical protein
LWAIKGTYVSVEPFHLFRYLDEETFRYNERKLTNAERFRPRPWVSRGEASDLEPSDLSGGRVMAEQNEQEKVEAKEPRPPKPPGRRKFQRLLKQVINAPPLKKDEI